LKIVRKNKTKTKTKTKTKKKKLECRTGLSFTDQEAQEEILLGGPTPL